MTTHKISAWCALTAALALIPNASAQVLWSDNFDTDTSSSWAVNASTGTHPVTFNFDYSTVGIPSAPNSGGTTFGLKLQANTEGDTFGGVSVSPVGEGFTGDYELRFDMWLNYNGTLNGGGSGSTQVTGAGIGTVGDAPQWPGGTQDSVWFAATGDGGSSVDYRAYSTAEPTGYPDGSTVFAATGPGNRNASHEYYSVFGGESAPAEQLLLFPQQTDTTAIGTQGFAWRDVVISKLGDAVTYSIDGVDIATIDLTTVTLAGDNILLNHFDINASSSADPNAGALLFGLIDNVQVTVIPEPSTWALCALGGLGLLLFRRRK